jgi:hypothetical protein
MKYEKAQTGWFIIVLFSTVIAILTICYLMNIGSRPLPLDVYIILATIFILLLLVFYRLKIRVDNSAIHIIYGIGLVHIRINPEKINQVTIVKTPWYSGLGIRITEKGMLYNIQGQNAVEISYLKGEVKTVQIGSNDALALKQFIENTYNVKLPL